MGDNVYLGDRDGVRTPMQWTGDRNGGFSRADFAQLYLPPLMDPVYGFQAVNVEAQLRTPTSLLRWIHRFIALRKEHPVFGARHLRAAAAGEPDGSSRTSAATTTTSCSASTTSRARRRRSSSTWREFEGWVPEEMLGRTAFPADRHAAVSAHARPARVVLVPAEGERNDDARPTSTASRTLVEYIAAQRWYGSKAREVAQRVGRRLRRAAAAAA